MAAPLQIAVDRPTTLAAQRSWLESPFFLLMRASLVLALGAGFSLGVYLVLGFAFGLPLAASTPALMQVHGQVQVFGFIALFIMAVAVQLVPRFHASKLEHPRQVSLGGLLLAVGVTVRMLSQPLAPGGIDRPILLVLSSVLELVGVLLAVHAFARVIRGGIQPAPKGWAALLPITMGGSLLLALALNLIACIGLARGALVVPFTQDEALLHLEIWGFASTMVLAVSGRVFPRFLLLQPTRDWLLRPALALWAFGSFGVSLVWLFMDGAAPARLIATLAQLAGAFLYVLGLRLYEWPIRDSGMPQVTNPTRRWARSAFGLLLVAAAANVGIAAAETLGLPVTLTEISAGRHLVAQGYLLPLIVVMAARILPGYSGHMLHRPRLLAVLVWSLFMGAAVRGGAELVAGYAPGWGSAVALGGVIGAAAFVVFAVGLLRALSKVQTYRTA